VMFALYNAFQGIAMGGVSSGLTNLIFDYIPPEQRVGALAICPAVGGSVGFVTTLLFSALFARLQQSGLFGLPVYAQQLLSVACIPLGVVGVWYLHTQIAPKAQKCN